MGNAGVGPPSERVSVNKSDPRSDYICRADAGKGPSQSDCFVPGALGSRFLSFLRIPKRPIPLARTARPFIGVR
jgi:hypothetical protein